MLSCSRHPLTFSFLCFCYSWGWGFIQAICSGEDMLTVSSTNTPVFMSLCFHCVHMLSLVLCCCSQTGPFTTACWQDRSNHPSNCAAPQSITQPSYPLTHNAPLSHIATAAGARFNDLCVTLGPLWLIRCYNQTTKGLWHRDLLSILHKSQCDVPEMLYREQRGLASMRTIREAFYSSPLVNYVKCQGASVNHCGGYWKLSCKTLKQVTDITNTNHFLLCIKRGQKTCRRAVKNVLGLQKHTLDDFDSGRFSYDHSYCSAGVEADTRSSVRPLGT